jgi:hypothetical protein
VGLCGETAEREAIARSARGYRIVAFSAQGHECLRCSVKQPPYLALCGETAEREAKLETKLLQPARKLAWMFAPFTSHTLQRVYRIRNERVREFLQK